MTVAVDPTRSNGRRNILISATAPGAEGQPGPRGVGLEKISITKDGATLELTLSDRSIQSVPLAPLLALVLAHAEGVVATETADLQAQIGQKLGVDQIYEDASGRLRPVKSRGVLPEDFTRNGPVFIAGDAYVSRAKPMPAGLYLIGLSPVVMTDGSVHYPDTISNSGLLVAEGGKL